MLGVCLLDSLFHRIVLLAFEVLMINTSHLTLVDIVDQALPILSMEFLNDKLTTRNNGDVLFAARQWRSGQDEGVAYLVLRCRVNDHRVDQLSLLVSTTGNDDFPSFATCNGRMPTSTW